MMQMVKNELLELICSKLLSFRDGSDSNYSVPSIENSKKLIKIFGSDEANEISKQILNCKSIGSMFEALSKTDITHL